MTSYDSDARLDPVRRPPVPRAGTLLRATLVAALLALAAAVLYAEPGPAAPCPPPAPVAPDRLAVPDGLVGVPVGLADPAALAVVAAGDRVDLFGPAAQPLARHALVLEAVGGSDGTMDQPPALYLGLTEPEAQRVLSVDPAVLFRVLVRS